MAFREFEWSKCEVETHADGTTDIATRGPTSPEVNIELELYKSSHSSVNVTLQYAQGAQAKSCYIDIVEVLCQASEGHYRRHVLGG